MHVDLTQLFSYLHNILWFEVILSWFKNPLSENIKDISSSPQCQPAAAYILNSQVMDPLFLGFSKARLPQAKSKLWLTLNSFFQISVWNNSKLPPHTFSAHVPDLCQQLSEAAHLFKTINLIRQPYFQMFISSNPTSI